MNIIKIAGIAVLVLIVVSRIMGKWSGTSMNQQFGLNEEQPTDEDIRRVLAAGNKIYAIKLYRIKYNCGLKEAVGAIKL